jgi:uncharacterized repeat protein (TIGR01451 family)
LYSNAGEGPDSTGLYTYGSTPTSANSINLTGTGIDLHSGHIFNVGMTYDGTTLTVTITDATTQAQATQTYTVNIPAIVGGSTAYVGFTGGTGGATATQNVLGWVYTPTSASAQTDLQITNTDGQTTAVPGSAITYTIVVTNAGPSGVNGATVADALPATLTGVSYTATQSGGASGFSNTGNGSINDSVNLPVGAAITYVVHATVSSSATGSVANTASVTATADVTDTNAANNSATDTDTLTPQADLQITNTDGQTAAVPGTAISYTIVVTNAGPNSVTGASVVDTLPATLTGATYTATQTGGATGYTASGAGSLAETVNLPLGSTITYVVQATLSASATGTLSNMAIVSDPAGVTDTNMANNSVTDSDTLAPQADLQITNSDGQTSAAPGSAITYTIVVTNTGPSRVTGATVADSLPAALTNVTYTATQTGGATGYTANGSGNLADTVNLPAGSTITYQVHSTLSAGATGTLANTASVTAPAGVTDTNAANNSVTDSDTIAANPQTDLQITKTDGQTTAVPGSAITYTIVVTNAGPSSVTGATVADTFPATLTNVTYTATQTGGATGYTASGSGTLSNTVTMPASSTITYLVHATVSPSATGTLSNSASVTAPAGVTDTNAANNSATDTDTLTPQADLQITKTDGQTTAVPGSAITYTIVVTNAGPSSVTGATVADTFPATLTNVTYTATQTGGATGYTASGSGTLSNTVTMPAISTITYLIHATISPSATGTLSNSASVTAPVGLTDTNAANNSATDTDTLTPQADLQITNTDGQTTAAAGAAITYTIVATNAGLSNATGATVVDTLPTTLSGVTYTATQTGGATGYTASGSGNLSNTVTMPAGSAITYLVHATLSSSATGSLANTATVTAPASVTDTNAANNSVTDSDTISAAPTLNYPSGFTGDTSQFAFNGASAKIVGSALQLTSAGTNQVASIFSKTAVNVAGFSTQFAIQQLNGTNPSGDGMTFVIQGGALTAIGLSGGNLGFGGMYAKSLAIKFDLYNNSGEGPSSTGLYTLGATPGSTNSINLTPSGIDLHSGHVMNVAMTYDGTTLTVTITDATTLVYATQTYTVNIPSIVGGNTAYVGFTGATGGATATQNVLSWTYTAGAPGAGSNVVTSQVATAGATASVKAATTTTSTSPSTASSSTTSGASQLLVKKPH